MNNDLSVKPEQNISSATFNRKSHLSDLFSDLKRFSRIT